MSTTLSTKEAFTKLIHNTHAAELLDLPRKTINTYRLRNKKGKISTPTMEKYLKRAGWQSIPQQWLEPPAHAKKYRTGWPTKEAKLIADKIKSQL
jgi:hypothetical protein